MFLLAAIVTGIIVDVTGAAIAGAAVEYRKDEIVRADDSGRFTTSDLPPGTYYLRINSPGFVIRLKGPIEVTDGPTLDLGTTHLDLGEIPCCNCEDGPPTIALTRTSNHSSLRGRISNPPPDGHVEAILLPGPTRQAVGEDGTFEFKSLPPGRYSLRIEAPPLGPFEIPRLKIYPRAAHEVEQWIRLKPTPGRTVERAKKSSGWVLCL